MTDTLTQEQINECRDAYRTFRGQFDKSIAAAFQHAYALGHAAATAAERERCAQRCLASGCYSARDCAAAIRRGE